MIDDVETRFSLLVIDRRYIDQDVELEPRIILQEADDLRQGFGTNDGSGIALRRKRIQNSVRILLFKS